MWLGYVMWLGDIMWFGILGLLLAFLAFLVRLLAFFVINCDVMWLGDVVG